MKLSKIRVEVIDHATTGSQARDARKKAGKTLAQMAKKLGYHSSYIHMLERGRANWNETLLKRFEKAL